MSRGETAGLTQCGFETWLTPMTQKGACAAADDTQTTRVDWYHAGAAIAVGIRCHGEAFDVAFRARRSRWSSFHDVDEAQRDPTSR